MSSEGGVGGQGKKESGHGVGRNDRRVELEREVLKERGGWQGEDDKVEGMMREEVGVVCEKRWERSVDVCLER